MINTGSKVNFTEEELLMFADIERIVKGENKSLEAKEVHWWEKHFFLFFALTQEIIKIFRKEERLFLSKIIWVQLQLLSQKLFQVEVTLYTYIACAYYDLHLF